MDVASRRGDCRGFAHLKSRWDGFDILVHAVAFAPREALTGNFIEPPPARLSRGARYLQLQPHGAGAASLPLHARTRGLDLTLSYLGAMRSIPGYNVMGLAKASLEANVRFLAADLGPAASG